MTTRAAPGRDDGLVRPAQVYDGALRATTDVLTLRERVGGATREVPVGRWLAVASAADERLLARARGPVLDVGCGPGRHVHALARRGVLALGVDVSPVATALARRGGAAVLETSIFDAVPGAGTWGTALLLDGNIGIGGCALTLLRRVGGLLRPGGSVLAELDDPGTGVRSSDVRLEHRGEVSAWFTWVRAGADAIDAPARDAGLDVAARWTDEGRWFAELRRR